MEKTLRGRISSLPGKPLVSLTPDQWESVAKAIEYAIDEGAAIRDAGLAEARERLRHQLGFAEPEEGHTEPDYACRLCNP